MSQEIKPHLVNLATTLREVMHLFNTGDHLFAVVIDEKNCFLGVITDGDLRRSLVAGINLDESIKTVINRNPLVIKDNKNFGKILEKAKKKKIGYLPLVRSRKYIGCLEINNEITIPFITVIFAGGEGKRMRPLTLHTPKPLVAFKSSRLIDIVLNNVLKADPEHIFIITLYMKEKFSKYFAENYLNSPITIIEEKEKGGTAGGLKLVPKHDLPILITNADLSLKFDVKKVLFEHFSEGSDVTILATKYKHQVPFGTIKTTGKSVDAIKEKPTLQEWICAGVYVINQSVLGFIPRDEYYLDMPDLIELCIKNSLKVNFYPLYENWADIGNQKELEDLDD